MIHSKRLLIIAVALAVLGTGCASTAKLYAGPDLAHEQIAVIEANPMIHDITDRGARFGGVDGAKVSGMILRIDILPGKHTVDVQCSFSVEPSLFDRGFGSLRTGRRDPVVLQFWASLTVEVEAGHTYRLDVELTPNQMCKPLLKDISTP